ncbi:MAG: hypothetical protein R2912_05475 [Eubacteriales bacterium]
MGDNRAKSIDSRDIRVGQISLDSIRGVVTRMLRSTNSRRREVITFMYPL